MQIIEKENIETKQLFKEMMYQQFVILKIDLASIFFKNFLIFYNIFNFF